MENDWQGITCPAAIAAYLNKLIQPTQKAARLISSLGKNNRID